MVIAYTKACNLAKYVVSEILLLAESNFYSGNLSLTLFSVTAGRAHSIVVAERVVLNFMQRMSGIATLTKVFLLTWVSHYYCS